MTVRELNDKMQAVDIDELIRQAVISNASKIVTLNRRQMETGKNIEGDTIGVYQSKQYAKFKKEIGSRSPFMVPDLKLTGDFHGAMILEVEEHEYYITSTDEKAPALAEKYPKIFGLTKESQEVAKEFNTRSLGKLYKQAIGL